MNQPFMNFEIREKVQHFKDGQSFQELSSLELEPIVKVYEKGAETEVTGYLVLSGEFLKKSDDWESQFEQSDGIHYSPFFNNGEESMNFQYQIPVSLKINSDRVSDPSDIFLEIQEFDYRVITEKELELVANVKLLGVHPEPKQDTPVESTTFDNFTVSEDYLRHKFDDLEHGNILRTETEDDEDQNELPTATEEDSYQTEGQLDEEEQLQEVVTEKEPVTEEVRADIEEEQAEEVVAPLEDPLSEPTSKVKIGIKGNSKNSRKSHPEQETYNPIYSLLKKKETAKEQKVEDSIKDVNLEEVSDTVEEVQPFDGVNNDYEFVSNEGNVTQNKTVVSMEDYRKEKLEDELEAEEVVEEVNAELENKEAKKNITTKKSSDMLYGLMRGDEEKYHKLKLYFVKKEDTLDTIAAKYHLSVDKIMNQNKLNSSELEVGQVLYLPVKGK